MKALKRPSPQDALTLFDAIVDSKEEPRRSTLAALRGLIHTAYRAYETMAPDVQSLIPPTPSADEREALLHCYDVRTKPFESVYQALFESTYFCPYCEIVKVQSLDHFLDKATYPDLATLPLNLVPACIDCNRLRPDGIVADGARCLMHPYFDKSPNDQLLKARIERVGSRWRADFQIEDGATGKPAAEDLYRRHHRLLGLIARYSAWADEDGIPTMRSTVATWGRDMDPNDAIVTIQNQAAAFSRELGANHPKTVIHLAAAEHADFVRLTIEEGI